MMMMKQGACAAQRPERLLPDEFWIYSYKVSTFWSLCGFWCGGEASSDLMKLNTDGPLMSHFMASPSPRPQATLNVLIWIHERIRGIPASAVASVDRTQQLAAGDLQTCTVCWIICDSLPKLYIDIGG
jgi:hypothetical protein